MMTNLVKMAEAVDLAQKELNLTLMNVLLREENLGRGGVGPLLLKNVVHVEGVPYKVVQDMTDIDTYCVSLTIEESFKCKGHPSVINFTVTFEIDQDLFTPTRRTYFGNVRVR